MELQVAKCFGIFHVLSFYNKLNLVDALFARTQTRFGSGQTVYFGFINKTFLSGRLTCKPVITGAFGDLSPPKRSSKPPPLIEL